jgi:hypothetical protein
MLRREITTFSAAASQDLELAICAGVRKHSFLGFDGVTKLYHWPTTALTKSSIFSS